MICRIVDQLPSSCATDFPMNIQPNENIFAVYFLSSSVRTIHYFSWRNFPAYYSIQKIYDDNEMIEYLKIYIYIYTSKIRFYIILKA